MHKVDLTHCPAFFTNPQLHEFIKTHANDDSASLLLSAKYRNEAVSSGFPIDFAALQIDLRRKGRHKLPDFIKSPLSLFPSTIAYEQASNEYIARFHASILSPDDKTIFDMTAGLGIDAMAFAGDERVVTACELDKTKAELLCYNASVLRPGLLFVYNDDSVSVLTESKIKYDVIFVDPARRDNGNNRKFAFQDCKPDIIQILDVLLSHTKRLLIKASPMLDITAVLNQLPGISHLYAVCFKGECKEILIEISSECNTETVIHAVDINDTGIISDFSVGRDFNNSNITYNNTDPDEGMYLYEPNAAIMKIGCWKELEDKFPLLTKIAPNTHLFCSSAYISDFPGRCVRIKSRITKKERRVITDTPLNIVTRNYPVNAEKLKSQLHLKNGGKDFLYAFRSLSSPQGCMYLCEQTDKLY